MTSWAGVAEIAGLVELAPERRPVRPASLVLEQWASLAKSALADANLELADIDGIVTGAIPESSKFVPATVVEYLGITVRFAERVDLGGASSAAMVWRAAAAIELGLAKAVLVVVPAAAHGGLPVPADPPPWLGASSAAFGSPQAEFEIPFGIVGQNAQYGQIARRYGAVHGWDERAGAKIAVDQRVNACHTPAAVFHGTPITIEDVLASEVVADPMHLLEVVMPCQGGAALVVAHPDLARRSPHRRVRVKGFGESVAFKSPTFAADLLTTPLADAADRAFTMARVERSDIDLAALYDCYTITVMLGLEDAGFCRRGEAARFIAEHDLTFRGDFPINTSGGQLSFGQAGYAGGMHQVCDAVRQLSGRAGTTQLDGCELAFVSGNGGIMSEHVALVLEGA